MNQLYRLYPLYPPKHTDAPPVMRVFVAMHLANSAKDMSLHGIRGISDLARWLVCFLLFPGNAHGLVGFNFLLRYTSQERLGSSKSAKAFGDALLGYLDMIVLGEHDRRSLFSGKPDKVLGRPTFHEFGTLAAVRIALVRQALVPRSVVTFKRHWDHR